MQKTLTFGTDPEFAIFDPHNRIVSAIPILQRNKIEKIDLGAGAKIYYDNTLAEANIDPAESKEDLTNKLADLYRRSQKLLKDHKLGAVASHNFSEEECEHPGAKEFGCDPEKDVYRGGMDAYPPNGGHVFRSAGGHIHVGGLQDKTSNEKMALIVLMDIFVGLASVLMDNDPNSVPRKQLYGKAGRYRDTPYGIEYRVLSNFWLSKKELTELIYDLTMFAANLYLEGKAGEVIDKTPIDRVIECINNGGKESAKELFFNLDLPANLKEQVQQMSQEDYNPDIFSNWKI
jgi:hypothetical protein